MEKIRKNMDALDRKKVSVISKYAVESFSESDWYTLGQITGKLDVITGHSRLLRSLSFSDDDYGACVVEVMNQILSPNPSLIGDVVDHFDIDLWYQQKEPEKYNRLFVSISNMPADFWLPGHLKIFVSHVSGNKAKMSFLKAGLRVWGGSAFIAHEDIEPSREWRVEIETALDTMEVLLAVVEPGFKESDWCDQEVGYALGRKIDVIPLRLGLDPYGFFGKFQGIQIKDKKPKIVAAEIAQLLLKKPKYRDLLLQGMQKSFSSLQSTQKTRAFEKLDSWSVITDSQMKDLLENSSLSEFERNSLKNLISKVNAFEVPALSMPNFFDDDDIPF